MRRSLLLMFISAVALGSFVVPAEAQVQLAGERVDPRAVVYSKLMNTRLRDVDFADHDLSDVIEFLEEVGDIDILVHWAEEFAEGLQEDSKITLRLRNETPLVTVLELVMEQAVGGLAETTWSLGEGYVEIGTKEALNKNKYVMIYPVRELLFQPKRFDEAPELDLQSVLSGGQTGEISQNIFEDEDEEEEEMYDEVAQADELTDIITSLVDQYQWERNGGEGGSIRYFRGNLIVNAADYLHRQVAGYPFSAAAIRTGGSVSQASAWAPRYVTLTGRFENAEVIDVQQSEIPILVGGRVIRSGGNDG